MARLHTYFGLCTLLDQEQLLGISNDFSEENVVITLSKNMVIRCKLADQKQIGSWNCTDKLSSPVVFDQKNERYIGVFNRTHIRTWKAETENLGNLKKFNAGGLVFAVVVHPEGPLLLYSNGVIRKLDEHCKLSKIDKHGLINDDELIEDHFVLTMNGTPFVALIIKSSKGDYFFFLVGEQKHSKRIALQRESELRGWTIYQENELCQLFTLWSDNKLYKMEIDFELSQEFPGNHCGTVTSVGTKLPTRILPLSKYHLCIYGMDPNDEGAALIIVNTRFDIIEARHHLKVFTPPPRMWKIENRIVMAVGRYLVVVPYTLENTKISSLISSRHASVKPENGAVQVEWEYSVEVMKHNRNLPMEVKNKMKYWESIGKSGFQISYEMLPVLMKHNDISSLFYWLQHFKDIPESSLVDLLQFCFTKNKLSGESNEMEKWSVHPQRAKLLKLTLKFSLNNTNLLCCLRNCQFSFVMSFMNYLLEQLISGYDIQDVIRWISLIIDSHYQKYLLCQDPQILELLKKMLDAVNDQLMYLKKLQQLHPLLQCINKKKFPKRLKETNKLYSIGTLKLY